MGIGWPQVLIFLLIVLILFGGKKLPELAHALGKSLNEFKKGKNEDLTSDAPQVAVHPAPQVTQQASVAAPAAAEAVTPEVVKS